jgi:molecular chaperone HtpG
MATSDKRGTISVKTRDILPIIKKWLYSEHDIFIRELVANATDAITKRKIVATNQNLAAEDGKITIEVNKTDLTIKVKDNGIGMTAEEVEKYITQVAFSGAQEFVDKMKKAGADTSTDIIGKFGLGFYSSFMVAERVDIETLSVTPESQAVRWSSTGDEEYTLTPCEKNEIGTTIVLHLPKENAEHAHEFLDAWKLEETLRKFCDFMPYPIIVIDSADAEKKDAEEKAPVNETKPLWRLNPNDVKDEDYKQFYQKHFPMDGEPLFWVHLKVDHPFTLEGILFFPKLNPGRPFQERNIRLYQRQVFVTDNVKNIVPEFLSLLKGHIDSSDIPLNVSRSSLQGDPNIKKVSNYIVKKVAEALKKLWTNDRSRYEAIWEDIGLFVKYGCLSDTKFDEMMRDKIVFKNSEGKFTTLEEYRHSVPESFKTKLGDKVVYFEKGKSDSSIRRQLQNAGLQTIEVDDYIDPHFMQHVEMHKQGELAYQFGPLDAEVGKLFDSEKVDEADIQIKELFEKYLRVVDEKNAPEKMDIELHKVSGLSSAAYFKVDEQMKRLQKMTQSMGTGKFPIKKTLVINTSNPIIKNALKLHQKGGQESLVEHICHHVESLAHISSEGLNPEEREKFVSRSQELIEQLTNMAID